jgi:hypothetical protein
VVTRNSLDGRLSIQKFEEEKKKLKKVTELNGKGRIL